MSAVDEEVDAERALLVREPGAHGGEGHSMMSDEEYRELERRLTELNSKKAIKAFMRAVAKKYGDDDPLAKNLGEFAAMLVHGHYKDLSP